MINTYYVSLVRGLIGYYVKFTADNENIVREHCAEYFGRLWCSVYDEKYFLEHIYTPACKIINEDKPIHLGCYWEWE